MSDRKKLRETGENLLGAATEQRPLLNAARNMDPSMKIKDPVVAADIIILMIIMAVIFIAIIKMV